MVRSLIALLLTCALSGLCLRWRMTEDYYYVVMKCFASVLLVVMWMRMVLVAAWREKEEEQQQQMTRISQPHEQQQHIVISPPPPSSSSKHNKNSNDDPTTVVVPLLEKCQRLFNRDQPFEAVEELDRVRASLPVTLSMMERNLIEKIDTAKSEIFRLTQALNDSTRWKYKLTHNKCTVMCNIENPRDFKVSCLADDVDLFDIIALIYETDLYKYWVPGICQSERYTVSLFHQLLYLRAKLPRPFSDRDMLMKGYGDVYIPSDGHGAVMIYVASVENKPVEVELNVRGGATRAEVEFSGIYLVPGENGGVHMTMITRLDLKMPYLPEALFDLVARYALCEMLVFLKGKAKDLRHKKRGSERWQERMQQSPQVYNEIRSRLARVNGGGPS